MTPAEALTTRIGGRWHGSYGTARCPAHDDHNPSLTIRDGDHAPLLRCKAGCDQRRVIEAVRYVSGPTLTSGSDSRGQVTTTAAERRQRDIETLRYVKEIWRQAQPISETPAERYLRARGITGPIPPSLRYAVLKHTDTGLFLPCMVAAVQGPDRSIIGLHRTFLRGDGETKAPVSNPRKMLGTVRGGAVRLAAAEPEMAVGEGIETCLSYQRETGIPTWAALSTSGIMSIILPRPPLAGTVHFLVDLDDAGEQACAAAAERLIREGRKVKLDRPIVGRDFNDAVKACRHD